MKRLFSLNKLHVLYMRIKRNVSFPLVDFGPDLLIFLIKKIFYFVIPTEPHQKVQRHKQHLHRSCAIYICGTWTSWRTARLTAT